MNKNSELLNEQCEIESCSDESDKLFINVSDCSQTNINITLNKTWVKESMNIVYEYYKKRDHYLFTAIRNLLKKNNFLELLQQQLNDKLTDKEFNNEINNHPEKYLIEIKSIKNQLDYFIIIDLVNKIGFKERDISVNEVSELFSVNFNKLLEYSKESQLYKTLPTNT